MTHRERELSAIIASYNDVTEQLKRSHDQLRMEVTRLHGELVRKNAELRRRERLAALGEMAAGVAHEIRNPLGGISVYASLLARDLADRPGEQRLAEKISKYVGTLEGIVTDILDFGRPTEPNPVAMALGPMITETIELAMGRAGRTDVEIDLADELAETELTTDPVLFQRALLNLVVNAIEAGADHVVLRSGRRVDDGVSIEVADDGPGLSDDQMDRIFNPFFTTKDSGTGLGLAIVHQIVETLDGHIRARHGEDGGAVFELRLPNRPLASAGQTPSEDDGVEPVRQGMSVEEVA